MGGQGREKAPNISVVGEGRRDQSHTGEEPEGCSEAKKVKKGEP